MSFGDAIQRRADLLRKRGADVDGIFRRISKGATQRAIAAAEDKTPMSEDDLAGVNTRSTHLKQHWGDGSTYLPVMRPHPGGGVEYVTILGNNIDYASYVDQGHRLTKHFVPGLMIDPATGKLQRVEAEYTDELGIKHIRGIVVGTKTSYVPGHFMTEAGRDVFEDSAIRELNKIAQEVFRDG